MRTFFYTLAAFAAMTLATACADWNMPEEGDDGIEEMPSGNNAGESVYMLKYRGTVTVESDPVFADNDVEWGFRFVDGQCLLMMNQTTFAEGMPGLDMQAPVQLDEEYADGATLNFSAEEVVPLFNGEEKVQYTLYEFECTADGSALTVSFVCIGLKVTYEGSRVVD